MTPDSLSHINTSSALANRIVFTIYTILSYFTLKVHGSSAQIISIGKIPYTPTHTERYRNMKGEKNISFESLSVETS